MKRLFALLSTAILLVALCLLSPSARAQDEGGEAISIENKHVLLMVKAKITPEVIIEKIRTSPCNFDTFPPVLAEMRSKGVPNSVLLAMVKAPHGPSAAEQDVKSDVVLHPVAEVVKYSGNYAKTRESVRFGSIKSTAQRPSILRKQ